MTKAERTRLVAWRFKVLQHGGATPRNVARTCRYFGISRKTFYKWKGRYDAHREAGLCDRPRVRKRLVELETVLVGATRAAGASRLDIALKLGKEPDASAGVQIGMHEVPLQDVSVRVLRP